MADIDHQYSTHLGLVLCVFYHQILLAQRKIIQSVIDLGVFKAFRHANMFQRIPKSIFPELTCMLVAFTGFSCFMVSRTTSFDFSKDLVQSPLTQHSFQFGGNGKITTATTVFLAFFTFAALGIIHIEFFTDIPFGLQVFNKIVDGIIVVGKLVFLVEFAQPVQSLLHIARSMGDEFLENLK